MQRVFPSPVLELCRRSLPVPLALPSRCGVWGAGGTSSPCWIVGSAPGVWAPWGKSWAQNCSRAGTATEMHLLVLIITRQQREIQEVLFWGRFLFFRESKISPGPLLTCRATYGRKARPRGASNWPFQIGVPTKGQQISYLKWFKMFTITHCISLFLIIYQLARYHYETERQNAGGLFCCW